MVRLIKKFISSFFSRQPKLYTIPFGPIKGMKLFTTFQISPRMMFGFDETWVSHLAKHYIKEGDIVYDIGAHIGYTSILFSNLVGKQGEVHAFELLPSVAKNYLEKTVNANQLSNIKVHAIGLADKKEEIDIYVGNTMMGTLTEEGYESQSSEKCQIDTLDNYILTRQIAPPQVIKIDVERAEIACLKGAIETIKNFKPTLIIEFHNLQLLQAGYEILNTLGYQLQTEKEVINESYLAKTTSFYGNTLAISKP
ncbi:MAG: FkbM family methyltransferase [Pedobacter sp.]|nr:MAG: FkbM family methyltransferase [Pedobacter sp.]